MASVSSAKFMRWTPALRRLRRRDLTGVPQGQFQARDPAPTAGFHLQPVCLQTDTGRLEIEKSDGSPAQDEGHCGFAKGLRSTLTEPSAWILRPRRLARTN